MPTPFVALAVAVAVVVAAPVIVIMAALVNRNDILEVIVLPWTISKTILFAHFAQGA